MSQNHYKGTYLMEEQPLSVQAGLAQMFGTDEAIFLQQLHWWKSNPFAFESSDEEEPVYLERADYEGLRYVRLELKKALDKNRGRLRFLSEPTLKRIISKLHKTGVLKIQRFTEHEGDRTNWYALDIPLLEKMEAEFREKLEESDPSDHNDTTHHINKEVKFLNRKKVSRPSNQSDTTGRIKDIQSYKDKRTVQRTVLEDQQHLNGSAPAAESLTTLSDEEQSKLIAQLIKLRVDPDAARKLVNIYPESVVTRVAWWQGRDVSSIRKLGAAVRSSIEHPEKWPMESTPQPDKPKATPTAEAQKQKVAERKAAAARKAFELLPIQRQKYITDQAVREQRPLEDMMWDFEHKECAAAYRLLDL